MAVPLVSGVSPATGATGTNVTIGGSGFTGTTAVTFGTVDAPGFTVKSDVEISVQAPAPNASGSVDVTVTNADGTSAIDAADAFAYDPLPVVTAISPTSGVAATSVTVTGTGFTGATGVAFGADPGTALNVASDTQLTVTAPAAAASGAVDVVVSTPGGQSSPNPADQFTFLSVPMVTGVAPAVGQNGTIVTLTGSGFTGATSVAFGTTAGTALSVASDTQLTIAAPTPTASGVVDVTVTTPNGTSATGASDQFTFNPVPIVSAINPASGGAGITVTITGSGFTGATSATFGGVAATSFTVTSDTEITVVSPSPNAGGAVDVIVVSPTGSSAPSAADQFTFVSVPVVTSLSPASGAPGAVVTVAGANFTGATAVNFGNVAGTAVSIVSDSQLTVTAPAPNASGGSVDVTVTTPNGTSSTAAVDQFTYNQCCIATFNVPTGRSGCTTVPSGAKKKIGEKFRMEIDFSSSPAGCVCSCGEYRQFVRGTFSSNGTTIVHLLPNPAGGAPLKMLPRPGAGAPSDNFLEDGVVAPPAGTNVFYGHRSEGNTDTTDQYLPDRPAGCQYRGNDFPGLANVPGTVAVVDLDFRGMAIDVCNSNGNVKQNEWTVTCSGTL